MAAQLACPKSACHHALVLHDALMTVDGNYAELTYNVCLANGAAPTCIYYPRGE